MNTKLISFIILLLLIPFVFADINSFPNTIVTKTFNGSINITTEQDSHTYDCMSNSTSTFTFTLQRNLTDIDDLRKAIRDFQDINSNCNAIDKAVQQYGDINTYFKLYTQCNSDYIICNKDKTDCLTKNTELTPFKGNYETCSKTLEEKDKQVNQYSNIIIPSIQTNLTSMSHNLNQSEKGKWLWFFFGAGIVGFIMIIREKKRNPELQKHRVLGLSGGSQK